MGIFEGESVTINLRVSRSFVEWEIWEKLSFYEYLRNTYATCGQQFNLEFETQFEKK